MTQTHLPRRQLWAVLATFGIVMAIGGTELTKVAVALPAMVEELSLTSAGSLWVADSYPLAAGTVLISSAVAADRFGRRRIYLLGLGLAALSAAAAALAPASGLVIAARLGQGIGAAMIIAGTVAIIRVSFPGMRQRATAYGVWVIGFSTGSALGPLVGGFLVELAGWRWVFGISVPVLLICFIAAVLVVPGSRNPDPPGLDALSVALSALAIGLLIAGLKTAAEPELPAWLSPAALAGGAAAGAVFTMRQLGMSRPFLDLRLLANPLLSSSAAVIAATLAVFNGVLYLLTQRFQVIDGHTAVAAGMALLPLTVASAAGGFLGPLLQRRLSARHIVTASLAVTASGFLVLTFAVDPLALAGSAAMSAMGLGAGIIMAIGANALMSSAPEQRTADAGAIQESAFTLGAGAGIAGFGALAIHGGADATDLGSAAATYGPGAESALGLGALLYVFFALAAGLILLSTGDQTTPQRLPKRPRPANLP